MKVLICDATDPKALKVIEDAGIEVVNLPDITPEELLETGDYGDLRRVDIVRAQQLLYSAIEHEQQSEDFLEKSIEKLYDALVSLGWEPPATDN